MIRNAITEDKVSLLAIAEATGLFSPQELDGFGEMMSEHLGSQGESENFWITDDENGLVGAAYYAPEPFSEGVWNLYFIGILPSEQGKGRGTALIRHVEEVLKERGERLLLVETSGVDSFEQTRSFYRKNGYDEEARIRDYYKAGDDKIIFRKALNCPA
ncbi:hypothetical protein C1752_01632 [Acaryochloris thomasi RCC1774]|uniref:N-acetyltransferase domain-containing protein n=1 Tax=Acaryochloris thomasi RCC1774 TaxID=1764569 RepID=A0A2W1JL99_9CYAN|nr:GNAT family N-acetyltransferase [Acaryochloris thomasi]PZD73966.1 hypothetical protein C1752_01632 [Acaryochloris thomasi RCC1774]